MLFGTLDILKWGCGKGEQVLFLLHANTAFLIGLFYAVPFLHQIPLFDLLARERAKENFLGEYSFLPTAVRTPAPS